MQTRPHPFVALGPYGIHSVSSIQEVETHVLKHNDTFAVFNNRGDITQTGNGEQGIYHDGTRFLSRMELWLGQQRPVLLNSTVLRDNTLMTADLTNPDLKSQNGQEVAHGMLHFFRAKLLWEADCYEHLRIRNYALEPIDLAFFMRIEADYADLFEVRGSSRDERGELFPPESDGDALVLGYRGLDGVVRKTRMESSPAPHHVSDYEMHYQVTIPAHGKVDIFNAATCSLEEAVVQVPSRRVYEEAKSHRESEMVSHREASCEIVSSNEEFNAWVNRSLEDLNLLLTETPEGIYPYAGIPWYSTVFGRDGLLTALMTLWVNPNITRGVLSHLAATQADSVVPEQDAEPGKILHEARGGEMAALGEIPFKQYYGTVDATPLFVALAGHYYGHTGDRDFVEQIWSNIERALHWIDEYGDADGDGFVEYSGRKDGGLEQQGWKDSHDSVFHADGTMARGPIALCEVQGYVYSAKRQAAHLAVVMGEPDLAEKLRHDARALKRNIQEHFWSEEIGTYALALDGDKEPCLVQSSNAGQVLLSGIATQKHAERVKEVLFNEDNYSGWGIRTLSASERRYNPMSYHNGSIWPHDNALIGLGLARYGYRREVHRLLDAFFEASRYEPLRRLPELFCGFVRRSGEGPTPYPVACAPQAWAAAVVFGLLQASLGLSVEADTRCVVFNRPSLPPSLSYVELRNLRVGGGSVDLVLDRHQDHVVVKVNRRDEDIQVVTFT